jgi:hypothetical protein
MDQNNQKMSDETVRSLEELGGVLRNILHRLVREGKAKIVDGKVVFIEPKETEK